MITANVQFFSNTNMSVFQACKETIYLPDDDEYGYDYSDDEFDLEDISEPNHREWLLNIYNGIWTAQTFQTLLSFDVFTEKVQSSYTSEVIKEVNGLMAPLGQCPELNQELRW